MLWLVILVIALPAQVINIVGEDSKGGALGVLIGVGAIPSTLGTPLFGALSDRCTLSLGRRRPFIIAGTLISIPLFFSVSYSATLPTLCLTYFFLQCSSNLCSGPFVCGNIFYDYFDNYIRVWYWTTILMRYLFLFSFYSF